MRILILGINYAPEMIGTARYTTDLAEAMAARGHSVRVVAAQPYYPGWKVFPGFSRLRFTRDRQAGVAVLRCPLYVPRRPTGARRIAHHASFAVTGALGMIRALTRERPNLVLVVAPSLISAPVGWVIARVTGAKAWLHVQDLEVEAAFATGLLPTGGWIERLARGFESWVLRRFDRVSTISPAMLRKIREKGVTPFRTRELRNWADLSGVAPDMDGATMRAALGVRASRVALYSGNLANKQGLEIIPDAARLLAHRDDIAFVICGEGPFLPELRRLCDGLGNVSFHPLQPRDRLGPLLAMADVHLLPQVAGAADLVLPSKLTNMLASGRPVVATADADSTLSQEVEGCGAVVPPGDAGAFAEAIAALLDDPATAAALGLTARQRAEERWAAEQILARFEAEAEALTAAKGTGAVQWQP